MKTKSILVILFTLLCLSGLKAQTQPQNWESYPIYIQTKYLTDSLKLEVVSGNTTVALKGGTDTIGTITLQQPDHDTSEVWVTVPLVDLPEVTNFGNSIVAVAGNRSDFWSFIDTNYIFEYSTDGINFHPTFLMRMVYHLKEANPGSNPPRYVQAITGFSIPADTKVIRYRMKMMRRVVYNGVYDLRFSIYECSPSWLPPKDLWYNFGEKGEFGFMNTHYNLEYNAGYTAYLYQTKGVSDNFTTQMLGKFSSEYLTNIIEFNKNYVIEDITRTGYMDIQVDNDVLKSDSSGNYSVWKNACLIHNLDINRDGRLDYLFTEGTANYQGMGSQNFIAYQQPNGLFSDAFIARMSFDEYNNTQIVEEDEWVQSLNPNNLLQGKGMPSNTMWPIRGGVLEGTHSAAATTSTQFASAVADLNKDGIPDLLAPDRGLIYYGLGNNTFVYSTLDGNVIVKDLNGDGVSDYIVYGGSNNAITAYIYEGEGQFKTPQVLMRNLAPDAEIYLYDFDKDGNIDVLITFSSYLNNNTAHTLFAKNDGNGNFDVEDESLMISLPGDYKFLACSDVDNDGFFDLFHVKFTDTAVYNSYNVYGIAEIQVRRGKANFQFEETETLFSTSYYLDNRADKRKSYYEKWRLNVADIDRDGNYEVWLEEGFVVGPWSLSEGGLGAGYLYRYESAASNTCPNTPDKPNVAYNAGAAQLDINWALGEDTESSPVDLTYALRIGTAPDLDDVFAVHAFADGTRKNLRSGNMGSELSHTFDVRSWKPGTYYVSVQTIDPMFAGSGFSAYATFEHTYLPNEFTISRTNQGSVTAFDTLEVNYNQYPESDLVYNWDFAGAEVLDSSLGYYRLFWPQAGPKTITLTVISDALTSDRFEQSLYVLPNKATWDDSSGVSNNRVALSYPLADHNMDGALDVAFMDGTAGTNGLWLNNGKGQFTQQAAAWNSTLSPKNVQWLDIDRNGRLDMFYRQDDESRYLKHSNTTVGGFGNTGFVSLDDYRFIQGADEKTWTQVVFNENTSFLTDFTNNGSFDAVHNANPYYGTDWYYFDEGTNKLRGVSTFTAYNRQWLDFNKDGFIDFCGLEYVYRNGQSTYDLRFYENLGTGSITDGYANPEPFRRLPKLQRQNIPVSTNTALWTVQDMNADGFCDLVYLDTYMEGTDQRAKNLIIEWNNQNQNFGAPQAIPLDLNNGVIGMNNGTGHLKLTAFDFDNNGYIDILTTIIDKRDNMSKPYIFYFDAKGCMAQGFLYDGEINYGGGILGSTSAFADIDGDGIPDFLAGQAKAYKFNEEYQNIQTVYPNLTKMQSTSSNTLPQPPTNLVAQQTEEGLLIEWDPAVDAETPFALMRYNLSVKKKGSNITADAYIISPLNGGNTDMAVLPRYYNAKDNSIIVQHHYIESTRFFIPASVLSGEVEIMVQAIDQWDGQSDFSTPIYVKISDVVNLAMSSQACFDEPITVTFTGTQTGTPVWDFDGAEIVSGTGFGPYEVKWTSSGIKTVSVVMGTDTSELQTLVYEEMAGFAIPDSVFVGTEYKFTYPALLPRENSISFHLMVRSQDQGRYPPDNMRVSAPIGESEGTITFKDYNFYNPIRVQMVVRVANNICTKYFDEDIQLMPRPEAPEIEFLAQTNGKIEVRWDSEFMDDRIDSIVILKEGTAYNQFYEIGRVAKAEHGFIDVTSNLNIRSEAYVIKGILPGNIQTTFSDAHQSPRLSITKSGDQNTLIWSQYIGTRINNFTILRGATPETMNEIETLPGHRVFFVDNNPDPGELYYALQYDPIPSSQFNAPARKPATKSTPLVQSNVVFAGDASQSVLIDRMNILAVQKTVALDSGQRSLILYPEFYPSNATFQNVTWSIVSGEDKATITSTGVLTGLPGQSGTIRVRVDASDGSNAFAERNIPISTFFAPCDVPSNLYVEQLNDSAVSLMWNGTNDAYKLTYYDTLSKNILYSKLTTETFCNLEHTDFKQAGTYSWSVRGICGADTTDAAAGEMFTITMAVDEKPVVPVYLVTIITSAYGTIYVEYEDKEVTSGLSLDSASVLTLRAIPNTGCEFVRWWDNNTDISRNYTLEGNVSISALFQQSANPKPTYTVTIIEPSNGSIMVKNGAEIVLTGAVLDSGTVLTLTATPNSGYKLNKWWDNQSEATRPYTLNGNVSISAAFVEEDTPEPTRYTVNIVPSTGGNIIVQSNGSMVNDGAVLDSGAVLSLTAEPDATYKFVKWWDNDTTRVRNFTLRANTTISATFTSNGSGTEEKIKDNPIKLYPNPVKDLLYIQSPVMIEEITIHDIYGKLLKTFENIESSIDISSFPSGMYFIRIKTDEKETVHKIVKE